MLRKFNILIFIIILFFNASCKRNNINSDYDQNTFIADSDIPADISRLISDSEFLSDIIEYDHSIVLEISDETSIISDVRHVLAFDFIQIYDEIIYILDRGSLHSFDMKGNYIQRIGRDRGLGRSIRPNSFIIHQGEIIIADGLRSDLLVFNMEGFFDRYLVYNKGPMNIFKPEQIFSGPDGIIFYKNYMSGSHDRYRIAYLNNDLSIKSLFCEFEEYQRYLTDYSKLSSVILTNTDTIWITNNFNPMINIYSLHGQLIRVTGEHLKDFGIAYDSRILDRMKNAQDPFSIYQEVSRGKRIHKKLINFNDQLVFYPLNTGDHQYLDIYGINGEHLKMLKISENCRQMIRGFFASSYNEYLISFDIWCEDIELDDDINAVLHFYKLRSK